MNVPPDAIAHRVVALATEYIRAPASYASDSETGAPVLEFDPPLTAEEQTTYVLLVALARSGMAHLSPTEYQTVRTNLASLRDFRQLGRNAFMALTAAERDRMLYDAQTATTIVLLAILRD
jgi:hypothetical protein